MKTTFLALIVASAAGVGCLAADSTTGDAKSVEPLREQRTVETTVTSESEFRKQSAEFRREGWSIHYYSQVKTNENGSVVWRWEMSKSAASDPASVDAPPEGRYVEIIETSKHRDRWAVKVLAKSPQHLHRQHSEWRELDWAVVSASRWVTNEDGSLTQSLRMSRRQTTAAARTDTCVHNLYQLRAAIHQWALENDKSIEDRVALADLERYFPNHDKFSTCPSGGTYSLHEVWDLPRCSFPKHRLMPSYEEWKLEHR